MNDELHRFPARVFRAGEEPDPRFSLANERTFLAWISTALALISVGVGLEAIDLQLNIVCRAAASVIFILAGMLAATQAWTGWVQVERALRRRQQLPAPFGAPIVTITVVAAALVLIVGMLQ